MQKKIKSHPAWVCGLKPEQRVRCTPIWKVTPCVGVWIETTNRRKTPRTWRSHPAWVCGLKHTADEAVWPLWGHTLRGCVDWNQRVARGMINQYTGHTLRGCVDWNINYSLLFAVLLVTPCVGVWIETFLIMIRLKSLMSHPAWVCGLKPQLVTTRPRKDVSHPAWVCGLKLIGRGANDATTSSHPAWVCGLKHPFRELLNGCNSHTLRGCVDWNPFKTTSPIAISCHTLRGCVDWNIE